MPRLSQRELTLRQTREELLQAFLTDQLARSNEDGDGQGEDEVESTSDSSGSSSSSCSSDESLSDTDSTISSSSNGARSSVSFASVGSGTSDSSSLVRFQIVLQVLARLEQQRVLNAPRLPRDTPTLLQRLDKLRGSDRVGDQQFFRHLVRMGPAAFDAIVGLISTHPVFAVKDKRRVGASPAQQAAVAFFRLGRFGNGGGVEDVAHACGCSEGSVVNYTERVATALYSLRQQVLCWASEEEKWEAKAWVAAQTQCEELARGWSMVDGSLIPLAFKPGKHAHHREYFDRKSQYSLNLQLVVVPTSLRIIDFVAGYKGSTQDSRAFAASDVVKTSSLYLDEGDFIWTDGGYGLADFTCGPYDHVVGAKSRDFATFNRTVSKVRVRSEHAFGYLKGRFQSLRGLRLLLRDAHDHTWLVKVVVAMLVAHNLALRWDGTEERSTFLNLDGLSTEAAEAWEDLQKISPEQAAEEEAAWARRLAATQRRKRREAAQTTGLSQSALDIERRKNGRELREEMHVALFAALNRDFEDTTRDSRLKDRTQVQYQKYLQDKKRRAEAARQRRRTQADVDE